MSLVLSRVTKLLPRPTPLYGSEFAPKKMRCDLHQRPCEDCDSVPAVPCLVHPAKRERCEDCVKVRSGYLVTTAYTFPLGPTPPDCVPSQELIKGLVKMVTHLMSPQHRKQLYQCTQLIAASSACMTRVHPVMSCGQLAFGFKPAPGNLTEVIHVLMAFNSRRVYPDVLIVSVNEGAYVDYATKCLKCGTVVPVSAVATLLNFTGFNDPFPCPGCRLALRIDSKFGEFGFHETWLCGHDVAGVGKLLQNFSRPTLDVPHVPDYFDRLSRAISIMHKVCIPYDYNSIEIPNFYSEVVVDDKDTAPGVINNAAPGAKKKHFADATEKYITHMMYEASQFEDISDMMAYLRTKIPNLTQTSIKLEARAALWTPSGWVRKQGERMFFVVHILLSTLLRMTVGLMSTCGGYGTHKVNQPSGIGMSFFGASAQVFASEMFGIPLSELDFSFPSSFTVTEFRAKLAALNARITGRFWVLEYDIRKFDINTLASLLSKVWGSMIHFHKLYNDPESQAFLAMCIRLMECHRFKVFNCPSGSAWYGVASSMMSGSWDTAFMNTMCNFVSLVVVLMRVNPGFFDRDDWMEHFKVKNFGDDGLMCLSKELFTEEMIAEIPKVMLEEFNYPIPAEDFKIHDKVVVSVLTENQPFDRKSNCEEHEQSKVGCQACFGEYVDPQCPTFLKYMLGLVQCPRCSYPGRVVMHWAFVRPGYEIMPKLFVNSSKSLSIRNLCAKVIGYAYTVGINLTVYYVLKQVWQDIVSSRSVLITPDDLASDIDSRFGLDYSFWQNEDLNEFPSYKYLVDRMVCPYTSGDGPVQDKTSMPVRFAAKQYQTWSDMCGSLRQQKSNSDASEWA